MKTSEKNSNEKKISILINEIIDMGVSDKKILHAIKKVPRDLFVRKENLNEAYENYPLPIGFGQTISQPYTVAFMIEQLELKQGEKVLEIGTGSGYNASIMAKIVEPNGKILSVEILSDLIEFAKQNLKKAGIKNVHVIHGDGSVGYSDEAPYDKIIVTAGCPEIPNPIIEQLKEEGIIVAPVESLFGQEMIKLIKHKDSLAIKKLGNFSFVPLKGKKGYR
ncbi:protein-L-isoaspartate(D-aspartate) O-methyltransferase [Candidatus Woesearchaeota archaeon]|nr:protein-L-isoaspartate(D-aspartate) O-methyltransferase [Candidatus Woesearchaeota archaeon]